MEFSDEENIMNEAAPAEEERESSKEEAGGSSDELIDKQEIHTTLYAKTSTYDRSIDRSIDR